MKSKPSAGEPIVLPLNYSNANGIVCVRPSPEYGYIPLEYSITLKKGSVIHDNHWVHPQLGDSMNCPKASYDKFVVAIGSMNYEVSVQFAEPSMPECGYISFTPTTATPTPQIPAKMESCPDEEGVYWYQEQRPMQHIGATELRLFGQPSFIQGPVFPTYDNKGIPLFCCLETGWGDCGNVNIFVHFDEKQRPITAFAEMSCA